MYRTDKQFMKNPATANCRIYVGGIPTTVVADDLEQKFRFHGKILGLVLQKGFAFIQFESENQAKDAIAKEHGAFLHGKKLNVRPALRPDQMNKGPMNQNQQKPQQNQPSPQQPQQQQQKAPPAPSPQNNSPQKKPLLNEPPPAPHHDEPEPQEEGPPPPHIDFTEDESNQEECNVPPPDIRPPQMQHQPPPNQHNNRKNQFNNNRDNYQDNAPDPPFMGDDGGRKWGNGGGRGGRRGGRSRDRQHNNFNNRLDNRENAPPPFYPQEDNYHHHYIAPPPLISRPERNDCEIIVVAKHLTQYAEYVESRLKAINLLVDLLFPNEDVPIGKVLANISSRGCLYAILVMPQNEEHKSVTLNILHGIPQEHRNMPIEDALLLMKANFNAYMRGERVGVANPCDGNMSLMDKHPQSVQMFLNILTENRHLTSPQYDKLIKYLQDKRQLQHEFEKNEGIEIESADPDNKQAELQSRIMNILNNQGTNENESIETLSLTNTNVAPPVTPSDGGDGPTPLLKDPTVQKALDSIMLGDMFKNMAG